jgi:hypothetical protein
MHAALRSPRQAAAEATKSTPVSKAVMEFDGKVEEIAKARGIPRYAAMTAAR